MGVFVFLHVGIIVMLCVQAAEILAKEGISAEVRMSTKFLQ